MLKIKDNIDLKELEKLDFIPEIINYPQYDINNETIAYYKTLHEKEESGAIIEVHLASKQITINADLYVVYSNSKFNDVMIMNLDILYDLIKEGLVEKVEGE